MKQFYLSCNFLLPHRSSIIKRIVAQSFLKNGISHLIIVIGLLLLLQPKALAQNGPSRVFPGSTVTYTYGGGRAGIFDHWEVYGGTITSLRDPSFVTIQWDTSPGQGYIEYTTYDYDGTFGNDGYLVVTIGCFPVKEGDVASSAIDFGILESCAGSYTRACYDVTGNGTLLTDNFNCTIPGSGTWGVGAPDIYYKFTLTSPSKVIITTCDTDFDTVLLLFNWANQTTPIGVDDDSHEGGACHPNASRIARTLPAGTYLVIVDGWDSYSVGNVRLSINTAGVPPALSVSGNQTIQVGGSAILTATGADNYTWSANGLPVGSGSSITVQPSSTTTYVVTGTTCNATQVNTKRVTVYVSSENLNYITTRTVLEKDQFTEDALWNKTPDKLAQSTTYFDGLGRPMQTVTRQGSPSRADIVLPVEYDAAGRTPTTYLPYTGGTTGMFQTGALASQQAFYQVIGDKVANDTQPSSQTVYENSPLNRVIEQGGPGLDWQPSSTGSHTVKLLQRTNTASEARSWVCGATPKSASSSGFYNAGSLMVVETTDENGNLSLEYKNGQGQLVLKKVQEAASVTSTSSDASFLITQYIYDDLGNLRLVIQPQGTRDLGASVTTLSSNFIDTWCFRYEYDGRKRVVEKQVPGAGPVEIVYNRRDQVILQRGHVPVVANAWMVTKYDVLGRPALTGIVYLNASTGLKLSRVDAQQQADTWVGSDWERPLTTAGVGYTYTESFPVIASDDDVLTVKFYDNYDSYDIAANPANAFIAEIGVGPSKNSSQVTGLVTGSKARLLSYGAVAGGRWLTTVTYYDEERHPIQTRQELYPRGWERTTLTTDFLGRTRKSLLKHNGSNNATTADVSVAQEFDYDHANHLVEIRQQVDTQPMIVLAHYEYNELGQLVDKKLHSLDVTANSNKHFSQSLDYRYNIRGWLTNINDRDLSGSQYYNGVDPNADGNEDPDLFGMELKYNENQSIQLSPKQYNGNISEVLWRTNNISTGNIPRGYAYSYDPANRLKEAAYRTNERFGWGIYNNKDYSTSNITYEANGNLKSMNRQGQISAPGAAPIWGGLDQLSYSYKGNRLVGVDDAVTTASTHDFKDATGLYSPTGTDEYEYDGLGNLILDHNKGLTRTSYNILNKPFETEVYPSGPTLNYTYTTYMYSAAGQKLKKEIVHYGAPASGQHTTNYMGSFVYEDGVLQYTATPEGRMFFRTTPINGGLHWKYEYHLRDHLGNLRLAFTDDGENSTQLTAGMEPSNATQEERQFSHIGETRLHDAVHARTGDYVARLEAHSGHRQGPSIRQPVAAGDSVYAEAYGRYDHELPLAVLTRKGALVTGLSVVGTQTSIGTDQTAPQPGSRRWLPSIGASITLVPELLHLRRKPMPVAYLRYELFNRDSQLVDTRTLPLARTAVDEWQRLKTGMKADSAGYVQVSLINESNTPAYFDDLTLVARTALTVQENNYDPFGLNLVGIESTSGHDSMLQYNGKEKQEDFGLNWTDYGARMYDMQLGRWHSVDPKVENYESISPYSYAFDNPIRFVDKEGKDPGDVIIGFGQGNLFGIFGSTDTGLVGEAINSFRNTYLNKAGGSAMAFPSYILQGPSYDDVDPDEWWTEPPARLNYPFSEQRLDKMTQKAYNYTLEHYNVDNGKQVSGGKVVILGYSFGGVLAMHLARRLNTANIPVELLGTLDAAEGWRSDGVDRTVPDNVKENFNKYQTSKDDVFSSHGAPNTRKNGGSGGIHNLKVRVEHTQVDNISVDDLQSWLNKALSR